jgi:hypothetical protein
MLMEFNFMLEEPDRAIANGDVEAGWRGARIV